MAHRAQQILEAVAAALNANASLRAEVEVNRIRSLSEDEGELPAVTVNYGADSPDQQDLASFGSQLEVELTAYCAGDSETEVLTTLIDLRRQVHISVMTDPGFGSLVWETNYGGADKPVIQQADRTIGAQTSRWLLRYLMNFSDPG